MPDLHNLVCMENIFVTCWYNGNVISKQKSSWVLLFVLYLRFLDSYFGKISKWYFPLILNLQAIAMFNINSSFHQTMKCVLYFLSDIFFWADLTF